MQGGHREGEVHIQITPDMQLIYDESIIQLASVRLAQSCPQQMHQSKYNGYHYLATHEDVFLLQWCCLGNC